MRRTLRDLIDSGAINAAAAKPMVQKPEPDEAQPAKPKPKFGQKPPANGNGMADAVDNAQHFHVHFHPPEDPDAVDPEETDDPEEDDPSAAEQDTKGSPLAQHVSQHMQDPLGATQKGFKKLAQTKMDYDLAREEAKRNLMPVQHVLDHVSQMHQLHDPMAGNPMGMQQNPDEQMGYDPQTMQPKNMMQQPGAQQMNPQNARMGVGNAPNIPGQMPGRAATGAQTQVRPPKMGVPKPGQSNPAKKAGNPGQKKPAGKGKSVKVEVHSASDYGLKTKGRKQIEAAATISSLRF